MLKNQPADFPVISTLDMMPGDIIVTQFDANGLPAKRMEVTSVERRRGCDGVHVNDGQCYSRCATVPVLRHSAPLAEFANILSVSTVSFDE